MHYGLVHTSKTDFYPQMVMRCAYLDPIEKPRDDCFDCEGERACEKHTRRPFRLVAIPGYYRPDIATPVGRPGECSLELAREVDVEPNVPLKLVEIPDEEIELLRERAQKVNQAVRNGAMQDRELARIDRSREALERADAVLNQ